MHVLLIDDHALFRFGLQELLQQRDIEVRAAGTGDEGIQMVRSSRPDVVLLDMRMPGMDGRVVLARLSAEFPDLPVSMLTTSADERDVLDTLAAGARGYLLKDMEPDDLIRALRDLAGGRTVVSPELTAVLARAVRGENLPESEPHWTPYADLTPREREILCHLAEGQSNKVIAKALGISDGTVKLHVKSILRKLSVHSRVEAAVMAVEHDLCGRNRAREARERQPSSDG
ncbi:MAG: response regulator transcription factor [Chromatiales bacterium]|nr:response regulator transcription factor [Chromatiales bacterium]